MKSKRLAILVATVMVATVGGFAFTLGAGAAPGEIRLHLGSDGRSFKYDTTTQNLTTQSNNCKINSSQPLIALTSTGSQSAPGLASDSIGVKGSPNSGNGTPCSQVDGTESLTFRAGSTLSGRTFTGVRLDLEMTGNAIVKLTFANGSQNAVYQLQTGTSISSAQSSEVGYDTTVPYTVSSGPGDTVDACAAPNSSGPNSGPNDNCEWTVQAGFNVVVDHPHHDVRRHGRARGQRRLRERPRLRHAVLPLQLAAGREHRHGLDARGHRAERQRAHATTATPTATR